MPSLQILTDVTEKPKVQRHFWHCRSHVIRNSHKANIFASHNKLLCITTGTRPFKTWLNMMPFKMKIKTVKNNYLCFSIDFVIIHASLVHINRICLLECVCFPGGKGRWVYWLHPVKNQENKGNRGKDAEEHEQDSLRNNQFINFNLLNKI